MTFVVTQTPEERFWAKVDKTAPGGCWQWSARLNADGYGHLNVDGQKVRAHRFAYEMLVGAIPEGLQLDHLCRNRGCVNPDHLEPVTNRENILRGETVPARNAAKTHCSKGHEFTPENTTMRANGWRECKTCQRAHSAKLTASRRKARHAARWPAA